MRKLLRGPPFGKIRVNGTTPPPLYTQFNPKLYGAIRPSIKCSILLQLLVTGFDKNVTVRYRGTRMGTNLFENIYKVWHLGRMWWKWCSNTEIGVGTWPDHFLDHPTYLNFFWDFGSTRWLIFFSFTSWNLAFQHWVFKNVLNNYQSVVTTLKWIT